MDVAKVGAMPVTKSETATASPPKSEEKPASTESTTSNARSCGASAKIKANPDDKLKIEGVEPFVELLGSVITHNCPGVRTSARVIQKMKQDSIRPSTPPPSEKELKAKDEKGMQKTPSQPKPATKAAWTNIERNYFFDALNEFGKDFDAIGNFINAKLKRKSSTDASFKTKDQVRQHYYQTFHKICKYIRFSEEVKKPVQELYSLINYGEMRRKLQFVTDKHFMKLKHLVYTGYITVRCKGKNIRIKTPTCKALRKLNQLDDCFEDIKLPNKVEVIVSPANMESFGRVQTLAQNPKAKAVVSLQKKVVNFIKTFQHKWRSNEMKLAEEESKMFPNHPNGGDGDQVAFHDSQMCFRPKPGVPIHRPLLSITEYLSSLSLSLSAYEDRIGAKVHSENLAQDRMTSNKRQRCDSNSEKRSPDNKKTKTCELLNDVCPLKEEPASVAPSAQTTECESSSHDADLSDELQEILSLPDIKCDNKSDIVTDSDTKCQETPQSNGTETVSATSSSPNDRKDSSVSSTTELKGKAAKKRREHKKSDSNFKPLISDDVIKKIRKGWTTSNSDDITIGDLYIVFGQDSKLELEYFWLEPSADKKCNFSQKQNGMPYNANDCDEPDLVNTLAKSALGNKLKHLLLIANLSERIRKRQCSCGHTCDKMSKPRLDREIVTKSFVSSKTFQLTGVDSGVFRQPVVPLRRPAFSLDPLRQMQNGSRLKMSKQVLVQRLLLPQRSGRAYDVVEVKNLQNKLISRIEPPPVSNGNAKVSTDPLPPSPVVREIQSQDKVIESQPEIVNATPPPSEQSSSITTDSECTDKGLQFICDQPPDENITFLSEEASDTMEFDESTSSSIFKGIPPLSPMTLIRDTSSNSRWLEENLNDFSLNSLLGHLDEINGNRDIIDQSSNLSVISESSVDYMTKFAEITASMQNEEKDL